jgi:pimeloyl-ACP methyl ester carboxylesterase
MPPLTVGTGNDTPIDITYTDQGTGRPVVLIHGWPLSGTSWENQVPALLDAGYRVVTYDRRGFGESSQPDGGYDYDTLTADLAALMTQLDLREATLVGFSMGGGEVARYLSTHGSERIAKVVFASAVPPYLYKSDDNPDGGLDDETIQGFLDGVSADRPAFLEEFTSAFFSAGDTLKVSEDVRKDAVQVALVASPTATLECIKAFAKTDFRDDLTKIEVPTLVLHGTEDPLFPYGNAVVLEREIPGARLIALEGRATSCREQRGRSSFPRSCSTAPEHTRSERMRPSP